MSRHPDLAKALDRVAAAVSDLEAVAERVQACCPHARVYHQRGHYGEWFNHPSIRICADCGLEEQSSPYAGLGDFVALRTDFFSDTANACQHRLPYGVSEFRRVRHGQYVTD